MPIGIREIAGFMDGDGCIGIYRVKRRRAASWHYVLNVIFSQSRIDHAGILDEISERYGGFIAAVKNDNTRCAPAFQLRMSGTGALKMLQEIRPYLRVRAPQADVAFKFMAYRAEHSGSARRGQSFRTMRLDPKHLEYYEECRQEMRLHNRRGPDNIILTNAEL